MRSAQVEVVCQSDIHREPDTGWDAEKTPPSQPGQWAAGGPVVSLLQHD